MAHKVRIFNSHWHLPQSKPIRIGLGILLVAWGSGRLPARARLLDDPARPARAVGRSSHRAPLAPPAHRLVASPQGRERRDATSQERLGRENRPLLQTERQSATTRQSVSDVLQTVSIIHHQHHQVQFRRARNAIKADAIAANIAPAAMIRAAVARRFDPLASSVAAAAASIAARAAVSCSRAASSCSAASASTRRSFIWSRYRCTTGRAGSPHTPASRPTSI